MHRVNECFSFTSAHCLQRGLAIPLLHFAPFSLWAPRTGQDGYVLTSGTNLPLSTVKQPTLTAGFRCCKKKEKQCVLVFLLSGTAMYVYGIF